MNLTQSIDLDDLAAKVAPLVAEILARSLVAGTAAPYTTRKGCGPAGVGDRAWKQVAPKIPGAKRVGRWIVVPRAAYDRWAAPPEPTPPPADEPWTPAGALASVGLRPTRR